MWLAFLIFVTSGYPDDCSTSFFNESDSLDEILRWPQRGTIQWEIYEFRDGDGLGPGNEWDGHGQWTDYDGGVED